MAGVPETPFRSAFELSICLNALCGRTNTSFDPENYASDSYNWSETITSVFTSLNPTNVSLSNYAYQLASNLNCSGASFVTAFVLADRLYAAQPQIFCPTSAHKILAACSIVGVKFTEDRYFTNKRYAGACGYDLKTLNTIERTLLVVLNFTVFVHPTEHSQTQLLMRSICGEMGITPPESLLHPPPPNSSLVMRPEPPTKKRKFTADLVCEENLTRSSCSRRRWTPEEDAQLLQLVQAHGKQWVLISSHMGITRDARSCSQRWASSVNPDIRHSPFSAQEDTLLIRLVSEYGTKWTQISQHMRGRSTTKLSSRYTWLVKHKDTSSISSAQSVPHMDSSAIVPASSSNRPGSSLSEICPLNPAPTSSDTDGSSGSTLPLQTSVTETAVSLSPPPRFKLPPLSRCLPPVILLPAH